MDLIKRSRCAFLLLTGSYALLTFVYVLPVDGVFLMRKITSILYFFPAVFLYMYFSTTVIEYRVRSNLIAVSVLIIFWSVLRAGKYIVFKECESIARLIWYLYYIPMLAIPQVSFQAALAIGETGEEKMPYVQSVTGILSVVFIVLIVTNDLHQLVFRFQPEFADWDTEYGRTALFWVVTVWAYVFFLASAVVLFQKCRLSLSRKLTWIPVLYLALGVLGLYLLNIGRLPRVWGKTIGEFPEMACYTLGGFWILCTTIGLVPSNIGYEQLFANTSLGATITDRDYKAVYRSNSSLPLTKEQLALSGSIAAGENILVYRKPVTGGFVYWQSDVTEINHINRQLEDAQEQIAEEQELIRRNNEWKVERAQIDAKSKVYDEIAVRVRSQSQEIAQLSEEVQEDHSRFEQNMRLISIYAAYIKRISNMMLLGAEGKIRKNELAFALLESVRYLKKAGICAEVQGSLDETPVEAEKLIALYECFEMLLEYALPTLQMLHIILTENAVKLILEGGETAIPEIPEGTVEIDEGTVFVRLPIREEAEG